MADDPYGYDPNEDLDDEPASQRLASLLSPVPAEQLPPVALAGSGLAGQQKAAQAAYQANYPATIPVPAMPATIVTPSALPGLPATGNEPQVVESPAAKGVTNAQAEYNRVAGSGAGVDQVKNRWGRVLGKIGDIAGSVLAPGVAQYVPGTTLNHQRLLVQDAAKVGEAQQQLHNQANLDNTQSQIAERTISSQEKAPRPMTAAEAQAAGDPTLEGSLQTSAGIQRLIAQGEKNKTLLDKQREIQDQLAIARGLKKQVDANGSVSYVPDPDSPITKYRQSQIDLNEAKAELAAAGNDVNSPAYQLALKKADTAEHNASIAAVRASAYMINAQAGAFGSYDGQPLPGAMVTDEGNPVGYHFEANLRPTGTERGRADLADSAQSQLRTMQQILRDNPNLFGPLSGHYTDFQTWLGSQDPAAARFKTAARVAADHLAGVFGGRAEYALQSIYDTIGKYKTNPVAAAAAIDQVGSTLPHFISQGTPRTVGSNAVRPGGKNPPNQNGPKKTSQRPLRPGYIRVQLNDGSLYQIPEKNKDAFLVKKLGRVIDNGK